ncbi:phosphoglycerate kinase, partial [archaeon]|nr:phosphoglycerate kinase [archaeon]
MDFPTLQNVYVGGKRVLVRAGFDVPIDDAGNILDDSRIKISIPTIKYLLEHGAKQIVIMTHLGRPEEKDPASKTDKTAARLSELIGEKVVKVYDFGENGIPDAKKARIVMLENLRFDPREKSKDQIKRDEFGKQLASLADIYVNDAFSNCHRDHASMTSVPKFLPSCAGISVEKEVSTISKAME